MSQPESSHEIVIVRRRGGDDHDDHHGGVWKVAFADFMTAMMAFFLVLWIVNSTTKQTRSSLARYFNPIRLSDTTPARKGLSDPREVDFDASPDGRLRDEKHPDATPTTVSAAGAFAKSRDEIGASATADDRGAGGRAMRNEYDDPFAWGKRSPIASAVNTERKAGDRSLSGSGQAGQIVAAVQARLGIDQMSDLKGTLDVTEVVDGTLISITDKADAGTFGVGSAEPERRQWRILAAIADVLGGRPESIVIRGHTDARQYRRGDGSENWRLSFARAQSALSGLVRGGLDERRVERIEAHADRKLRNTASPEAADNRRIEILLRRRSQ